MKPVPAPVGRPRFCYLPAVPGLCKAYIPRWFYNARLGLCQRFIYGGCGGNKNRFSSELACKRTCRPKRRCRPLPCLLHCKYGLKKDRRGCPICKCRTPPGRPSFCYLPAVRGRCKAYMPSWFYNARLGLCQRFIYGGCGGNKNRFSSELACQRTCRPKRRCRPLRCLLYCKYGFKHDKYGCPTCACRPPHGGWDKT
ncbi:hypothetical protein NP493_1203g00000 [Ridgeia piscesae]|uniref:Uncharacterized protein n=1 Tax=Ridgeia piscesae TaxID=27915 RepID=A0AAD9NG47_RIDPI|nr:hypothetical protein NP493_1203g00000 [Ridgeia piscesae]